MFNSVHYCNPSAITQYISLSQTVCPAMRFQTRNKFPTLWMTLFQWFFCVLSLDSIEQLQACYVQIPVTNMSY